jgi:hypothetical protein
VPGPVAFEHVDEVFCEILQVRNQVVQVRSLSPKIRKIPEVAKPGAIFLLNDELGGIHILASRIPTKSRHRGRNRVTGKRRTENEEIGVTGLIILRSRFSVARLPGQIPAQFQPGTAVAYGINDAP